MEDWALIRRLAAEEVPHAAIARRLGISRTTVIKAVKSDGWRPCGWWAFRGDCLGAYRSLPVMAATV